MSEHGVPAVLGTETEFGITIRNQPEFNPVVASSLVINAYAGVSSRIQWSYEEESPGRDARGFGYEPAPVGEFESGLVNVVLSNGARFYVDHAHPEYSTPECVDAREAALHDKAGELVMARRSGGVGAASAGSDAVHPQEQQRWQGQLIRIARELPGAASRAVQRPRQASHGVLRIASGLHRFRQGGK